MTLTNIIKAFEQERKKKKFNSFSDSLWHEVPAVIAGKRTTNFIPCYAPVLFNGKDLYYPLYCPVSVLCLEMKTIGE